MRHLASVVGDFDIACLETERVGFYERLGWEEWRGPLGGRSRDGIVPTPDQRGVMILRLAPNTEARPASTPYDRGAFGAYLVSLTLTSSVRAHWTIFGTGEAL